MSKLIVEMDMNGIPNCCGLCDPLFTVVCATKHDQTIDKMMLRAGRPSWCPIKGVLPDEHGDLIDRDIMYKEIELWKSTATDTITLCFLYHIERLLMSIRPIVEAERKDDGKTAD